MTARPTATRVRTTGHRPRPAEEVAAGRPTGPVVALRSALLALALGLVVPGPSAAQGPPPAPVLVPVTEAFTAARNAHDLPAVLALFAPDAVVRERRGDVPAAVWDTRDPQVVRGYLDGSYQGETYDTGGLVWLTGRPEIAAWAAAAFARHHRYTVGQHRVAGDTVGWRYREFVDPYQVTPGVSAAEGTAEAVVRGGRITLLSVVQSPASVQRQGDEMRVASAWAVATYRASLLGDRPSVQPRGRRGAARAAEPAPVGWPLALGGLAGLAAVTAARRRRRLP